MSNKQPKPKRPSAKDFRDNPLIGASKGATMAGASNEDIDELRGANTLEGDLDNDVNAAGGIDKAVARSGTHRPHR
ncbi:hypothetical protein J6500_00640 [Bradyrhizobium sp. WSM 1704]|uniref:hypothetical protein n=1 Tax=Bradyrhizobium semiaridum TaxID=2821404 RepID=UPI001CE37793|nr:hypothetical protein [Bradyrhizobium semiaridum]MCA6120414.1 hypothetical protein [Bradyrhizobium semiaridum]